MGSPFESFPQEELYCMILISTYCSMFSCTPGSQDSPMYTTLIPRSKFSLVNYSCDSSSKKFLFRNDVQTVCFLLSTSLNCRPRKSNISILETIVIRPPREDLISAFFWQVKLTGMPQVSIFCKKRLQPVFFTIYLFNR